LPVIIDALMDSAGLLTFAGEGFDLEDALQIVV
jgi:hypothetical protein